MKAYFAILSTLAAASATQASIFNVPGSHQTIAEAVTAAEHGDTILVGPGEWAESVDFRGKQITIRSTDGPEATTLISSPNRSCVTFISGETSDALLEGFTITGGFGMPYQGAIVGGGIYLIDGSNPTIRDCVIRNNEAQFGGGVHIALSSPTFDNCTFTENSSVSNGGAVRIHDNSFPTFIECTFVNNHTNDFGGAIAYGNDSTGNHVNCIFDGNTADIRGGAIYLGCSCSDAQVADPTSATVCPITSSAAGATTAEMTGARSAKMTSTLTAPSMSRICCPSSPTGAPASASKTSTATPLWTSTTCCW